MNQPKITGYMKPTCGWSQGVRAVLQKYNLEYEDRDIINSLIVDHSRPTTFKKRYQY